MQTCLSCTLVKVEQKRNIQKVIPLVNEEIINKLGLNVIYIKVHKVIH